MDECLHQICLSLSLSLRLSPLLNCHAHDSRCTIQCRLRHHVKWRFQCRVSKRDKPATANKDVIWAMRMHEQQHQARPKWNSSHSMSSDSQHATRRIPEVCPNTSLAIRLSHPLIRTECSTGQHRSSCDGDRYYTFNRSPRETRPEPQGFQQVFRCDKDHTSRSVKLQQAQVHNRDGEEIRVRHREDWCSSDDVFRREIVHVHQQCKTP